MEKIMITVPEACERSGLTVYMLRKIIKEKKCVSIQVGRKLFVNWKTLEAFLYGQDPAADHE